MIEQKDKKPTILDDDRKQILEDLKKDIKNNKNYIEDLVDKLKNENIK